MTLKQNIGVLLVFFAVTLWVQGGGGLPDIIPIPSTAPFPTDKPRVLVIHESEYTAKLPVEQLDILTGTRFRGWCQDNGWEFKSWDEETPIVQADESWKKALSVTRTDTPWMVFSNGQSGESIPLPTTVDSAISKLKEYTQ